MLVENRLSIDVRKKNLGSVEVKVSERTANFTRFMRILFETQNFIKKSFGVSTMIFHFRVTTALRKLVS